MDPITIIAFIIILSLLVFVHELGHFVVAKRAGITVEEFAIGFPPRLVKVWQDEGEITLNGETYVIGKSLDVSRAVQPGVEVYIEYETDERGRRVLTVLDPVAPQRDPDEADNQPTLAKQAVSTLQGYQGGPANGRPTVVVDNIIRPTEYTINAIPFGGYVRMVGEEDPSDPGSFASKSKSVRLAVLAAGSIMNLVAAVILFTLTAMSGVPEPVTTTNEAGEEVIPVDTIIELVVSNTPAEAVGLESGDLVVQVDEMPVRYQGDLVDYVNANKGNEILLAVDREGETLTFPIVPRVNPPEGEGAMGVRINHIPETRRVYYPFSEAVVKGVSDMGEYVALTFSVPYLIIQNLIPSELARPTGPVGIYQQTDSAVTAAVELNWWFPVLFWTAILSTALAVTNLLPLPALDGGRILFIIIEAIRGKRISPEKEGAIHFVGLALLLTLMIVITYYDFVNPLPTMDWSALF